MIPVTADDLIPKNSAMFYGAISKELSSSSAPSHRRLARNTLGWMEIKG